MSVRAQPQPDREPPPPPGWYADPWHAAGGLRYWDGMSWSSRTTAPGQGADRQLVAPRWARLAAGLVDAVVAVAVVWGVPQLAAEAVETVDVAAWRWGTAAAWALVAAVVSSGRRASVGRALVGVRVVRAGDGRPAGLGRAVVRVVVGLAAAVPLGAGWWPVLFDDHRRSLADRVAGTLVVRAGP